MASVSGAPPPPGLPGRDAMQGRSCAPAHRWRRTSSQGLRGGRVGRGHTAPPCSVSELALCPQLASQ
eukprot:361743-Chlamydomonas_euryale.AAC.1